MNFPKILFRVVENRNCPFYQYGDIFEISGIFIPLTGEHENSVITSSTVKYPAKRKSCKILIGDLNKFVIQHEGANKIPVCMISCSGCSGDIKLEHSKNEYLAKNDDNRLTDELGSMLPQLGGFSFFKNIDEKHLDAVISYFKLYKYKVGDIVIRKGDPGGRFFIIVTGSVDVVNDAGKIISTLDRGEVFGEMSLICNESVNATIKVRQASAILEINQQNFNKILDSYPAIQLYFSRLLAERLNKSNKIGAEDLSSGITGNLTEISAEALFQTLNMNGKTGILTITELSRGTARFSFRQGSLINARYADQIGNLAFYQILKEKSGRFRFTPGISPEDFNTPEIGFFMKLLMEGMRRLDEDKPVHAN